MALIGISGKLGSGKDTVGKIIQYLTLDKEVFSMDTADIVADLDYNGYCANKSDWKIKKFADKLKDITCLLIGCNREQLEDREFKEKELGEEWNKYEVNYQYKYDSFSEYYSTLEEANNVIEIKSREGDFFLISEPTEIRMNPRLLMQLIGTECGRDILHPSLWINSLFSDYIYEDDYFDR
jgi:dephospho-CoA kinase